MKRFATTGDLARDIRCQLYRVTYAIQVLGIGEDARAGTYRLYAHDRLPAIRAQLRAFLSSRADDVGQSKIHDAVQDGDHMGPSQSEGLGSEASE